MISTSTTNIAADLDHLGELVAKKLMMPASSIYTFGDSQVMVTELLKAYQSSMGNFYSAGLATADLAIAVDRASMTLKEVTGKSAFVSVINEILETVNNDDIIFVANPNRVSGSTYSLSDLERLAAAISEGMLIVDEYYFDHLGISALPLLSKYSNIVIIRSFTSAFGITSVDAGYLVSTDAMIQSIRARIQAERLSPTVRKTILATLVNDEALAARMAEVHEDALRLATSLNRIGVQCRITATDYLLMRVKDPKIVGNYLAGFKIRLENLDSYPGMDKYVRYKLQSYITNTRLIEAFEKMPVDHYRLKSADISAQTLRRQGEEAETVINRNLILDEEEVDLTPRQRLMDIFIKNTMEAVD